MSICWCQAGAERRTQMQNRQQYGQVLLIWFCNSPARMTKKSLWNTVRQTRHTTWNTEKLKALQQEETYSILEYNLRYQNLSTKEVSEEKAQGYENDLLCRKKIIQQQKFTRNEEKRKAIKIQTTNQILTRNYKPKITLLERTKYR